MNILISGGTGFIGKSLCKHYLAQGHKVWVWTRSPKKVASLNGITAVQQLSELDQVSSIDCVVNLAGAPILGPWWTKSRKQKLLDSRVLLTEKLVNYLSQRQVVPATFISASAIGFYGLQGDTILAESSDSVPGFPSELCCRWEEAANAMSRAGSRVCIMRLGVVLDKTGGMLPRMVPAFKFALGGRLGSGRQWFSWVHLDDVIHAIDWLMQNSVQTGVFNVVSPEPLSNTDFTKALGVTLNRPTSIPVPAWFLRLLLGEQSELLLGSQRVVPERLLKAGFEFTKPTISDALSHLKE